MDEIWVNDHLNTKTYSLSTQEYLRYMLHIEPFIKKAINSGWTVQKVEGFGKIYRRPFS